MRTLGRAHGAALVGHPGRFRSGRSSGCGKSTRMCRGSGRHVTGGNHRACAWALFQPLVDDENQSAGVETSKKGP